MLTTQSDDLADRLRLLRGHGMRPRYYHSCIGINSRLDSFQAAVLNVKFPLLDHWISMRQTNADRYTELFTAAGLHRHLGLPTTLPGMRHVWNQYVVRVPDGQRTQLREALSEAKIGTEIYYPLGLHQQQCFRYLGYQPQDLPETARAAEEVLALPIFPELRAEEQQFVVAADRGVLRLAEGWSRPPAAEVSHAAIASGSQADVAQRMRHTECAGYILLLVHEFLLDVAGRPFALAAFAASRDDQQGEHKRQPHDHVRHGILHAAAAAAAAAASRAGRLGNRQACGREPNDRRGETMEQGFEI